MKIRSLAVVMTCYNRCQKTLTCLKLLEEQIGVEIETMQVYLVDDGSTDNTSEEVAKRFPKVKVIKGDGNLFWNRGMHLAFSNAIKSEPDYFLWLNDDTHLFPNALSLAFGTYQMLPEDEANSIVVGPTVDPNTGKTSYGGYTKYSRWNPFRYLITEPDGKSIKECDTMCGNFVLVPKDTVRKIGVINPSYKHRWGDVDYGLRAHKVGIKIYSAPDHIGECEFNQLSNSWENTSLSVKERMEMINSIKGLQKEDWKNYTRAHGGVFWFLYWLSPYVKIYLSAISRTSK